MLGGTKLSNFILRRLKLMVKIVTNIYLIENLEKLSCKYMVYRIRGIPIDSDDYYKITQTLVDILSRKTKSPCALYRKKDEVFIAQPDGYKELPESWDSIRTTIKIEKLSGLKELNFTKTDNTNSNLVQRFLEFSMQSPLYNNSSLWQPKAGFPYFHKLPDPSSKKISNCVDLYRGFKFRVVNLSNGKFGICIDTQNKYISRSPLPTYIARNQFRDYNGSICLYEYGDNWYEIRIDGLNDLKVSEVVLPNGSSLYEDIMSKATSHKSTHLLSLPKDCSVLTYHTSLNEIRNVPSGLCRLTFGTNHLEVKKLHNKTIKPAEERKRDIQLIVDKYFRDLTFGSNKINLSEKPITLNENRLVIPEMEFGNKKYLSLQQKKGYYVTSLAKLGETKKKLLYSQEAGLYVKKLFDRQYFILPKSVFESYGKIFISDIQKEVQFLSPEKTEKTYDPIIIVYNDSVQKSIPNIGSEIIKAIKDNETKPGYGLVMIPRLSSKKEDILSNLVMRESRKHNLFVSIIHTTISNDSYEYFNSERGWCLIPEQRSKYLGYLKNVVINKILLLNSFWPYILKSELIADLTIGIDVKNNIAGFTSIYKTGAEIKFDWSESNEKEQLSKNHLKKKIFDILENDREILQNKEIKSVAIHRQGKLFPQEMNGIKEALKKAAQNSLINSDYRSNFIEIKKTSRIPFRLFRKKLDYRKTKEIISNPTIGTYYCFSENEAILCTTGFPFKHKGTTNPLHIIKIEGQMSTKEIIQDIFYLANLTWTKIDDCSRDPLTIKMTDIKLREVAGEYDVDALKFIENGDEDYE